MGTKEIDPEVRRFLVNSVPSVPYLEGALLLRAEGGPWDDVKLAGRLYMNPRDTRELLHALATAQIAVREGDGAYRYTDDPEIHHILDKVAATYAANLVGVTDLVHSKADRRARQFADAFKLRKD